jgi:hypothetical protein
MIQALRTGSHPGQSSVHVLNMMDLDHGNMTCIYSTLTCVCDHARRYNATSINYCGGNIIECKPEGSAVRGIILRLGDFYTLMSVLGSMGHIIAGSGLRRLFELVYAANTVTHMLTGKSYNIAFSGTSLGRCSSEHYASFKVVWHSSTHSSQNVRTEMVMMIQ